MKKRIEIEINYYLDGLSITSNGEVCDFNMQADNQTLKDAAVRAISFYFEKEISKLFEQCQNSTP